MVPNLYNLFICLILLLFFCHFDTSAHLCHINHLISDKLEILCNTMITIFQTTAIFFKLSFPTILFIFYLTDSNYRIKANKILRIWIFLPFRTILMVHYFTCALKKFWIQNPSSKVHFLNINFLNQIVLCHSQALQRSLKIIWKNWKIGNFF